MSRNLVGGLAEAKKVVQGHVARLDEFKIVIRQDDPGDDLNEVELVELRNDGTVISSYYSFADVDLAVVLVRAMTPRGFGLVAILDRDSYAEGRFARTAAS